MSLEIDLRWRYCAEYRYGFAEGRGFNLEIDLGRRSRTDERAEMIEEIRLALDDTTRRSEVRTTVGRL